MLEITNQTDVSQNNQPSHPALHFKRHFGIPVDSLNDDILSILNKIDYILNEKYRSATIPLFAKIPFIHPHVIPAGIRRSVSRIVKRRKKQPDSGDFPAFPIDFTVDNLRNELKERFFPDVTAVPYWPDGKKCAAVLSHDVDSDLIFNNKDILDTFLSIEEKNGFRSAWYFVSDKYPLDHDIISGIKERGHEVGFHGDKHDYRLPYLKKTQMVRRLDRCRWFLDKYEVSGGRSPLFLRTPLFLETISDYLEYDTSFHDTTIGSLTGLSEGCCSCFPFFIGDLLEIPTTITEEFILADRGYNADGIMEVQLNKLEKIRELSGIAHVLTHPEPHLSANEKGFAIYDKFLKTCSARSDIWITLPAELNRHWRRRDKTISA
ncbi:polysaccharide deacetylase family protein [candidate division KSB1 bacterium]